MLVCSAFTTNISKSIQFGFKHDTENSENVIKT